MCHLCFEFSILSDLSNLASYIRAIFVQFHLDKVKLKNKSSLEVTLIVTSQRMQNLSSSFDLFPEAVVSSSRAALGNHWVIYPQTLKSTLKQSLAGRQWDSLWYDLAGDQIHDLEVSGHSLSC